MIQRWKKGLVQGDLPKQYLELRKACPEKGHAYYPSYGLAGVTVDSLLSSTHHSGTFSQS